MGLLSATALSWMWDGKPDSGHVDQRLPGRPGRHHGALRVRHRATRRCSSALLAGVLVVCAVKLLDNAEDRRSGRRGPGPSLQRRLRHALRRPLRRRQDHRRGDRQRPVLRRRHDAAHRAAQGHRRRGGLHAGGLARSSGAIVKTTIGLRVSKEEEMEGLDIGEHGEVAYIIPSTGGHRSSSRSRRRPAVTAQPQQLSQRRRDPPDPSALHALVTCRRPGRFPSRHRRSPPCNHRGRHALRPLVRARLRPRCRRWSWRPDGSRRFRCGCWPSKCSRPSSVCSCFGSFKYQMHKNALTYGMLLVIVATFSGLASSEWHTEIAEAGWWAWTRAHLLSFQRPRRADSRRHDALHPRPDVLRLGHRADADARRRHVLPAAAVQRGRFCRP